MTRQLLIFSTVFLGSTISYGQTDFTKIDAKKIDTTYSTFDSIAQITIKHHFISFPDGTYKTKGGDKHLIWKSIDSSQYFDSNKFKFMFKVETSRNTLCQAFLPIKKNKSENAIIYEPLGKFKTLFQDGEKKAIIEYYDGSGQLIKKEKMQYTDDFYKSVQVYFQKKKKKK